MEKQRVPPKVPSPGIPLVETQLWRLTRCLLIVHIDTYCRSKIKALNQLIDVDFRSYSSCKVCCDIICFLNVWMSTVSTVAYLAESL